MVEEGGKALAAYLKPREDGRLRTEHCRKITDIVKTLGQVPNTGSPIRSAPSSCRPGSARPISNSGRRCQALPANRHRPVAAPDPKDRRFADPEWPSNQFFDFLKQAYLLTTQWADHLVEDAEGLDPHTRQKARVLRPADRQRALAVELRADQSGTAARDDGIERRESRARHAHAGRGHRGRRRRAEDPPVRHSSFEVGRNLAITPGKVIFQNDLMQLIQYAPTTEKVLKRPLLIVPPWINKFYVLDLTPEKSLHQMVRRPGPDGVLHLLGQSRRSVMPRRASSDYMREGPLRGARRDQARRPARRRSTRSAIASAARCFGDDARLHGGQARRRASTSRRC